MNSDEYFLKTLSSKLLNARRTKIHDNMFRILRDNEDFKMLKIIINL